MSSRACRRVTVLLPKALAVACSVAAVVAAAGSAPAAPPVPPRWLTPRDLSEAGADAVIPDVAVDPKGDVVVVWVQAKQSSWTVQAVDRPAGGTWGAPHALSAPANHVASPQVAIVGSNVVAVWERYDGRNLIAQTADRDPKTGAWRAPTSLSLPGRDAQAPRIAVDARGDAIVVWASVGLSGWTIESAYRPAGRSWQRAIALEPPQAGTAAPDVVLDSAGNAVAAWASTSGSGWRVHAAYRSSTGAWSAAVALSGPDPGGSVAPQLALAARNDVTAVWSRSNGTSTVVEQATRTATTGSWSPATEISPSGPDALAPQIAFNTRGDEAIVWTSSDQSGLGVVAAIRRAGKAWGPPTVLASSVAGPFAPQIALDPRGDALAVWSHSTSGYSRVQAAGVPAGGSWSAARSLSRPGADALTPQVAMDDDGDGAVAWARYNGQSFVVQGIGYDGSGPQLERLAVPAGGSVGKRLAFAVTPMDVWSAVRTVRWSFGDGATGSGRTAVHIFRRAGRFAVQVTATDSFGHVTSVRRWVRISAG
jgi:PKD domain